MEETEIVHWYNVHDGEREGAKNTECTERNGEKTFPRLVFQKPMTTSEHGHRMRNKIGKKNME